MHLNHPQLIHVPSFSRTQENVPERNRIHGTKIASHKRLKGRQGAGQIAGRIVRKLSCSRAAVSCLPSLLPRVVLIATHSMTASITLETIYGLEVQQKNDPWVKIAEEGVAGIIAAGTPGSNLVDLLPGLQNLPFIASLPGVLGRWKRDGLNYKNAGYKLRDAPFEKAKENYVSPPRARAQFHPVGFPK